MKRNIFHSTHRHFFKLSVLGLVMGLLVFNPWGEAIAEDFPSGTITFVSPTRAGGGNDRLLRAFSSIWKKYIKADFN